MDTMISNTLQNLKKIPVLFLLLLNFTANAQQNTVSFLSGKIANKIYAYFDKLPKEQNFKIYFSYLFYKDTVQTELSLELSRQIANNIAANLSKDQNKIFNKKDTNITFIYSTTLLNAFNKYITKKMIPQGDDNAFWQNFKKENTPDFYIFGNFTLKNQRFYVNEIYIKPIFGGSVNKKCVKAFFRKKLILQFN